MPIFTASPCKSLRNIENITFPRVIVLLNKMIHLFRSRSLLINEISHPRKSRKLQAIICDKLFVTVKRKVFGAIQSIKIRPMIGIWSVNTFQLRHITSHSQLLNPLLKAKPWDLPWEPSVLHEDLFGIHIHSNWSILFLTQTPEKAWDYGTLSVPWKQCETARENTRTTVSDRSNNVVLAIKNTVTNMRFFSRNVFNMTKNHMNSRGCACAIEEITLFPGHSTMELSIGAQRHVHLICRMEWVEIMHVFHSILHEN